MIRSSAAPTSPRLPSCSPGSPPPRSRTASPAPSPISINSSANVENTPSPGHPSRSKAPYLRLENFLQIADGDDVRSAATGLGHQLSWRCPERFFIVRDVGPGADLGSQQSAVLGFLFFNLDNFRGNFARWFWRLGGKGFFARIVGV